MSTWRLLGELPQARTREEIRAQSLDGWNPWQYPWNRCQEQVIVIPDPEDSKRFLRVTAYRVEHNNGKVTQYAVDRPKPGVYRFFVPAASTEEGVFEATTPRYEGFWRPSLHADSKLPWPQPQANWPERAAFLEMLDRVEAEAERIGYRGFSLCRVCGCRNGRESFWLDLWEWPSGLRHYLIEHDVRPSPEFEIFVRERAQSEVRLKV